MTLGRFAAWKRGQAHCPTEEREEARWKSGPPFPRADMPPCCENFEKGLRFMTRKQKKMVARIAASGVLLVAAVLIPYEGPWRFVPFLPAYFVIGWDVLWKAEIGRAHV